jgi:hypothetical protein
MKIQFQKANNNVKNFGLKSNAGTTSIGCKSFHASPRSVHYALLNPPRKEPELQKNFNNEYQKKNN